jgi:hypothetical protein
MLSLRQPTVTNVFLLLHAVSDQVALALAAAREVEGAERAVVGKFLDDVGTLEPIGAVSVHEDDAGVGMGVLPEDRSIELLIILVGDSVDLVLDIGSVEQVILFSSVVPRLNSE